MPHGGKLHIRFAITGVQSGGAVGHGMTGKIWRFCRHGRVESGAIAGGDSQGSPRVWRWCWGEAAKAGPAQAVPDAGGVAGAGDQLCLILSLLRNHGPCAFRAAKLGLMLMSPHEELVERLRAKVDLRKIA